MSHGPSTFGTMITSRRSPISVDERREVVEHPRRLERVHARPQRAVAEVGLAPDPDETLARRDLAVDRHGVLEVAEQHVAPRREVGQLRRHLLVAGVEEVDHPRRLERDLEDRLGGADGERLGEVAGVSHGPGPILTARVNAGTLASPMTEQHPQSRPIRPPARRAAPTRTAATSRSSRSAPSTSTGRRRPSPRATTTSSACSR